MMQTRTRHGLRAFAGLVGGAFLVLSLCAQAQPILSVEPKTVVAADIRTVTISSNGALDLSKVKTTQISFTPPDSILPSSMQISEATPRSLKLTFRVSIRPVRGQKLLSIDFGDVVVGVRLMVELAPAVCGPRNCRPPNKCVDGACRPPVQTTCQPACRPPRQCNNALRVCELPQ